MPSAWPPCGPRLCSRGFGPQPCRSALQRASVGPAWAGGGRRAAVPEAARSCQARRPRDAADAASARQRPRACRSLRSLTIGFAPATSAPGLGALLPHLRRDCAHPCPHLRRDWARPLPTSAPGVDRMLGRGELRLGVRTRSTGRSLRTRRSTTARPSPTCCSRSAGHRALDWAPPASILSASAPRLRSPLPHRRQDSGSPLSHLRRDRAHPCNICAETGCTAATSAPGLGSPLPTSAPGLGSHRPHLRRDWARPLPHLRRDWAHRCHICAGTGLPPPTSAPGLGLPAATSAPGLSRP
jgi:hypothetical protein